MHEYDKSARYVTLATGQRKVRSEKKEQAHHLSPPTAQLWYNRLRPTYVSAQTEAGTNESEAPPCCKLLFFNDQIYLTTLINS